MRNNPSVGARRLWIVLLLSLGLSSWLAADSNRSYTFGIDAGLGPKRGTAGFDLSRGITGFPKDRMYGWFGNELSAFWQSEHWYAGLHYENTTFLALFDSPSMNDSGIFGLVGVGLPYHPQNLWNLTIASGAGFVWGMGRGALLSKDTWVSTYAERPYSCLALPLELRTSLRFHEHAGMGLRYLAILSQGFSGNMTSVFFEFLF